MEQRTNILFVDDEPSVLQALRRVFRGSDEFICHFADGPLEALKVIAANEIAVLVSDHRMPRMTGAEFLGRIRQKRPGTVAIMLTGQANLESVETAVNKGEVYRFLLKPWDDDELRQAVRGAVQHYRLKAENTRLMNETQRQNEQLKEMNQHLEEKILEQTKHLESALLTTKESLSRLENSLEAVTTSLFSLIELARSHIGQHSRQVAEHCDAIGRRLNLNRRELADLRTAALLHDIGKVGFPLFILEKNIADLSPEETVVYRSHPLAGADALEGIEQFQDIREYIRKHHERFDKSGFPTGVGGRQIPMQAYAIGIADSYDHLINRLGSDREYIYQYTCQKISEMADKQFPAELVRVTLEYMEEQHQSTQAVEVVHVQLSDIVPEMQLGRNLYTMSGTLLLAAGTKLTISMIERVRDIAEIDPVAGDIVIAPSRDDLLSVGSHSANR